MNQQKTMADRLREEAELKEQERSFVFREEPASIPTNTPDPTTRPELTRMGDVQPRVSNRVPITTRCRPELAIRLKRASLERQLRNEQPYFTQDIVEEALESWLAMNGFPA